MKYVGIDIGLSGGIAVIDDENNCMLWEMPVFSVIKGKSKKKSIDEPELIDIFKNLKILNTEDNQKVFICLEKQASRHKQGVVSVFKLGFQYGLVKGIIRTLELPFEYISSKEWQSEFGIVGSNDTKFASYEKASSLFPLAKLKTDRGRILDGLSDALCMAEYIRRKIRRKS